MNINTKKIITVATGLALAASIALPAFAKENNRGTGMMNRQNPMMENGIVGTVTSINGTTITVNGLQRVGSTTATTTFTVDASKAIIRKGRVATSTISVITVGDKVMVQGTVTGTSVVAKTILDGIGQNFNEQGDGKLHDKVASTTSQFIGNGQPVIIGSITAINGNTLTITTMASTTYTVDASNAKILQGPNTVALSTLTVGNKVVVQGTINGTAVSASAVINQVGNPGSQGSDQQGQVDNENGQNGQAPKKGFFGNIGGFFKHLFGF